MKNAFVSILLLTVVGLAVLLAGALYFGAPLFGWIIMISIFAVFIVEQSLALKKLKQMASESDVIDECERRHIYSASGEGVVASRIKLAERLLRRNIRLDSPIAFDVLSTGSSISVPRSAGGTVILLGLMGTFFGLMYSVATAGGAIDNSTTQGTLDTIQLLFQGMKGIFGTSLCGLFAALILNASRSILIANRDSFMSRLDSMTLDMQGDSGDEVEKNKSDLERLFDSVERNLAGVSESVKDSLVGVVNKVCEELSQTTAKLDDVVANSMKNLGDSVSASLSGAFTPMEQSVKALSASVESIPSKLDEKLNGLSSALNVGLGDIAGGVKSGLDGVSHNVENALSKVASDVKDSLDGVATNVGSGLGDVAASAQSSLSESSKNIAESVAEQVKQSNEQWNEFMQRLEERATANVDAQKDGLETLKNVALQVAEKAQAGSAELSQSVSEKLGALSTDILGAFQKLSETSAVLLEAQKNLTESIDNRVVKEKEATDALGGNIVETAELMRVNQSELSANLEMLRTGLEAIIEKLSGDTAEREDEDNFVEHLNQTLEAFHERASEVLLENAVKTQEILLEVMEQTQRGSVPSMSAQPKVEE